MKSTGVVICNYNKSSYVVNCIQSVLESKNQDFDIFVVDNASTDDSVEQIKKHFSPDDVTLFVNESNLGGSGGFNTGIRYVVDKGYRYVWCLDNDVLVDENAFHELQVFLDNNESVGMAGSKIYHMQQPDIVQQYGITIDFNLFCVEANHLDELEDGSMPPIVYSDAVAACSVLVRCSLIREIGPMPEENFLYWDDTEWGMRCNLAGYKVASVGSSMVLHEMGAKKEEINTFATYYAWRNWIVFFMKYVSEDKLESMCNTFLKSVFEIIYSSKYHGEENKANTVMAAYDDAIHLNMGKASADKIFVLDKNETKLYSFMKDKKAITIIPATHYEFSLYIKEKLERINPDTVITILTPDENSSNIMELNNLHSSKNHTVLRICDFIFGLDDLSCQDAYIDLDFNLFSTKEEALMILNYLYSRESFIFSQKPLFLRLVKKARETFYPGCHATEEKDIYI